MHNDLGPPVLPFSILRLEPPGWLPATPGWRERGRHEGGRRKEAEKKCLLERQPAVTAADKFPFNLQIIISQEAPNYKILNKIKAENNNIIHNNRIIIAIKRN